MITWTDLDYAYAAIDMLPNDADEIDGFLRVNKVSRRGNKVQNWVKRWTDTNVVVSARAHTYMPTGIISHPAHVREYLSR